MCNISGSIEVGSQCWRNSPKVHYSSRMGDFCHWGDWNGCLVFLNLLFSTTTRQEYLESWLLLLESSLRAYMPRTKHNRTPVRPVLNLQIGTHLLKHNTNIFSISTALDQQFWKGGHDPPVGHNLILVGLCANGAQEPQGILGCNMAAIADKVGHGGKQDCKTLF